MPDGKTYTFGDLGKPGKRIEALPTADGVEMLEITRLMNRLEEDVRRAILLLLP